MTVEPAPPSSPPPIIKRRKRKPFDWSTAGIATMMTTAATIVFIRDGRDRFLEILYHDLRLFADVLLKVGAGCLIGAFLARLLPRELVAKWIGAESGFAGLLIATLLGALLPGGPVTIYPVASAFLVVGADVGATIAFITSWTLLGYTRALVWEIPFFGLEFVGWRILLSTPLPIIAGLLARLLIRTLAPHWEGKQ
ncbi:MAG: permease [Xanthobacteraceae bacterium]